MNKLEYEKLINTIFNRGKKEMDNMEVFIENNKEIEINVFEGEIDGFNISESGGLSLRGIYDDRIGYSYTEKLDESSVDMLIEDVIENGKYIDSKEKEEIFFGSNEYKEVDCFNESLGEVSIDEKIEFIKKLEREAFKIDDRVVAVNTCVYWELENERFLVNTKGLDLKDKRNMAIAIISVTVKSGEDTKTGESYIISNEYSKFDFKKMAKEAVEKALSMLGASSIKSREYPIIFRNDVFASILEAFASIFSAENVQKGLSLLKNRLGEQIANSKLTIVDDPFMKEGLNSKSFDDEGTAIQFKKIVDNGVLKNYLYNWKAAKIDGVESTGNAHRNSYKSSISIAPTNFYVSKGEKSLENLIESIDEGLMIVNVEGLHSGLNPVSGDYSLSAYGYEIENGNIKRPVNQITIAGNFFETLMNIEDIGNDLIFIIPFDAYVGSPSIKVSTVSVSGE